MTLILEDGTGIAEANAYASEDMGDTYTDDRALSVWTDSTADKEAALIRASIALDGSFRGQFPGTRMFGRLQGLEWPRANATDTEGNLIANDEVPTEVIQATIELAIRELATPGSAMPDLDRAIKMFRAGPVEVQFAANATQSTVFSIVQALMSTLVGRGASPLIGESARG